MKIKRIFAAVLAAAMMLSFAACSNSDTQGGSSEPAGEQTTEERTTEPQTNEDGSLVKPKNAVSVSDDVKIKTYSGTSLIEIGNRVMEPYGNAYKNMKAYADALNKLKAEMPNTKAYCLMRRPPLSSTPRANTTPACQSRSTRECAISTNSSKT